MIIDHAIPKTVTVEEVQQATNSDQILQKVISAIHAKHWKNHKNIAPYFKLRNNLTTTNNLLLYQNRIIIPTSLKTRILSIAHQNHLGITNT